MSGGAVNLSSDPARHSLCTHGLDGMQAFFHSQDLLDELPHFNASMFRVVSDGDCAPELMPGTTYAETPKQWKGWIRQQLVKLSCARLMHTPFYLIMDSDVFVARPMTALNLFETVRPITQHHSDHPPERHAPTAIAPASAA